MPFTPRRPRSTLLTILALWAIFYATFTLFTPPLLDDADSVHAEVAREMLLRHDYVTLYANGIRYLEKAPLLYWSIAASFRLFGVSTAAARIPLALTILALALATESFARRIFHSTRAGLYAALILLSSPGLFLYTRITLPDAMVCLWLTLALYAFYLTEQPPNWVPHLRDSLTVAKVGIREANRTPSPTTKDGLNLRILCYLFATTCALNVLTKGLIGIVFPIAIVLTYLLLTRGPRNTLRRIRQLHPFTSLLVFLAIAAPWHILIALANHTQGHPGALTFTNHHWQVPLPTNGNVHGWLWFYFINEQLLRYLNLRVPRDYDTVPLYLFWGLCLIWLMPWSAFIFNAAYRALPWRSDFWRNQFLRNDLPLKERASLLLMVWAGFVLMFFSLSTRQEYYVLPAFPAIAIITAGWLELETRSPRSDIKYRSAQRVISFWLIFGTLFVLATIYVLLHAAPSTPNTDLASLLQQNPGDYAMSMGHFLDLNANALGLFRLPLLLAAIGLFAAPLTALILRRNHQRHAATLTLAAGAFTFLLAAHLGLQTFAPVLTSAQLAQTIAPQIHLGDLIVIHGEYETGSTLGFYLQRPSNAIWEPWGMVGAENPEFIHILQGRSSNLWYGSFFPDAPPIFETPASLAQKWPNPQRIWVWQDLANQPSALPPLPGPIYVIAKSGGKEIVSNQPNHP